MKKDIDTSVFDHWGYVGDPAITNDGKFAAYTSQYGLTGPKTLTVCSTLQNREKNFGPEVRRYSFTKDSKFMFVLFANNTLSKIELNSNRVLKTYNAINYKLLTRGNSEWVFIESPEHIINIVDSENKSKAVFENISNYLLSESGNRLFLVRRNTVLSYTDIGPFKEFILDSFPNFTDLTLDLTGENVAFKANNLIKHYRISSGARKVLFDTINCSDTALYVSKINKFSSDGSRLFILMSSKQKISTDFARSSKVKIWSYQDARLNMGRDAKGSRHYLFYIEIVNKKLIRIQQEFEDTYFLDDVNTSLIAIKYLRGVDLERHWNKNAVSTFSIYNCKTGVKQAVSFEPRSVSPDGEFVIGYNKNMIDFEVLNVVNGRSYDLTALLKSLPDQRQIPIEDQRFWRHAGWLDSHTVLMYDEYDIWKVDVSQPNSAINVTKSIGKQEQLVFRFADRPQNKFYSKDQLPLLYAFDSKTKQNGFYRMDASGDRSPKKLSMDDCIYGLPDSDINSDFEPIKARETDLWIVRKERADTSPNFYTTRDFRSFRPLSKMYPEANYNWLTSELINFKTIDGKPSQAVLYKPANFDPSRKYPVIFNYYQEVSHRLNHYPEPERVYDNLNVPWFLSRGYLVCTPDIIYTKMKPGESAVNAVVGIARHLTQFPWIDSTKMGLDGHSWGAFETNYIITHTNLFSAAVSSSGVSDLISAVTSITPKGSSTSDWSTFFRYERFGLSLWDKPSLYISHSPIMDANKATTPLLIMANENDGVVNQTQGIQFFFSLRRLGKPVWLLQYDGETHSLSDPENSMDYGLKMLDFFDYYLKGKDKPKWMDQNL